MNDIIERINNLKNQISLEFDPEEKNSIDSLQLREFFEKPVEPIDDYLKERKKLIQWMKRKDICLSKNILKILDVKELKSLMTSNNSENIFKLVMVNVVNDYYEKGKVLSEYKYIIAHPKGSHFSEMLEKTGMSQKEGIEFLFDRFKETFIFPYVTKKLIEEGYAKVFRFKESDMSLFSCTCDECRKKTSGDD